MVYMVIYQAHDGVWHVWESPLSQQDDVAASVDACYAVQGEGTPIKVLYATSVELLAALVKEVNRQQGTVIDSEPPAPPYEGQELLPEARPYHTLGPLDKRRLDIEMGPGGDHDTVLRYRPTDKDLLAWSHVIARIARGELQS